VAILGTAGHVDHGKSSLVQALTSINPDRLPEEKQREMTIDLGFAWLTLSSGRMVGIIDVPGHEDFVKNMIAGVGGIDAALLIVAQDEGWMPQTEEHLRILDFLGVRRGIVALNKIDLNDDLKWLDMVEEDIRDRLKGTTLADAPIVRVSARAGTNIDVLRQRIDDLISNLPPVHDSGRPRLPVDRVFTIKGSGVVVTGTLLDGSLTRGDEVYIFPRDITARIRTIESYKEKLEKVAPGTRVALNLAGMEREDILRGDIIFRTKEEVRAGQILDVRLRLVPNLIHPVKSGAEYKVYLGTREATTQVMLIGQEVLKEGDAFAQLRFKEPVDARIGDHFILRRVSPGETVGGGTILDPLAARHKYRDIVRVTALLERRTTLNVEELVLVELDRKKYIEESDLLTTSNLSIPQIGQALETLRSSGKLLRIAGWIVNPEFWQKTIDLAVDIVAREHAAHPTSPGLAQAELESRLKLPKALFSQLITVLTDGGRLVRRESILSLSTYKPTLSTDQERQMAQILKIIHQDPANSSTRHEVETMIPEADAVIKYMCQQGLIIELSEGLLLENRRYQDIKQQIIDFTRTSGSISIQQMRTLFGFSRKYIIPLFNKLEEEGVLRRIGEERVLAKKKDRL
jgi:selenocysteine-specific elongation factor